MEMKIPKKSELKAGAELFNHQVRITEAKTKKLARVREVLGGYSTAELLEILIDMSIENYYDGENPDPKFLPKQLQGGDE